MKQYCGLCEKRCPLETLSCGKGRQAYTSELLLDDEVPDMNESNVIQSERLQRDAAQSNESLGQPETISGLGEESIRLKRQSLSVENLLGQIPVRPDAFEQPEGPNPRPDFDEPDESPSPMDHGHPEDPHLLQSDKLWREPSLPTVPQVSQHEPFAGEPLRPPMPDEMSPAPNTHGPVHPPVLAGLPSANVTIGPHYPPRQGEPHQPPVHDEPPHPPVPDGQHRPHVQPGPHHPSQPGEPHHPLRPGESPYRPVPCELNHPPIHDIPPCPPEPGGPDLPPLPPEPHHPPMPGGPIGPGRGRFRPDELLCQAEHAGPMELLDLCHRELHRPEVGVARGQERALVILAERGKMSQRELQDMLRIQPASMSELIYKLERKGCLTRERSEDRRANLLRITEAGRKATAGITTLPDEELLSSLTTEEREQLTIILRKLLVDWVTCYAPPEPEAEPV